MIYLVEKMLDLHKHGQQTPYEDELRNRELQSTNQMIDQLVYEMYGLTKEEIRLVEDG